LDKKKIKKEIPMEIKNEVEKIVNDFNKKNIKNKLKINLIPVENLNHAVELLIR